MMVAKAIGIRTTETEELHFEIRDTNNKAAAFTRHSQQQSGTYLTGFARSKPDFAARTGGTS